MIQEQVDPTFPILFKPMGTPKPEPYFIASDADYVDYITELMGGFAIPDFLKAYRKDKRYLLIGMPLNRDSERMVMSDITYDAGSPRGWVLNKNPTPKEIRFCKKVGLEIIDADVIDLLNVWQQVALMKCNVIEGQMISIILDFTALHRGYLLKDGFVFLDTFFKQALA